MYARLQHLPQDQVSPPPAEEIRRALGDIVASAAFAKAPRMCKLLAYLVDKKLAGQAPEVNEYAIGLELFGRDARSYDTGADPLVRVQVGRLRERLNVYYAAQATPPNVHISIPLGNYVPVLRRAAPLRAAAARASTLAFAPLRDLGGVSVNHAFICGLDEELGSKLFHTFGNAMQLQEGPSAAYGAAGAAASYGAAGAEAGPAHRLEGSIRIECQHVRASVRLIDARAGHIAWLSQFDGHGQLGMGLQEELAGAICDGLMTYFAHAPA